MGDALESIYYAAKEHPNCDPYFIPIPYYDRLPNGDIGKQHYEGKENYPDDIEITYFEDYDIEARRPDAILNFNPYDGLNKVTSIDPDYYFEKLKEYTDMLIWVPYYVMGDSHGPGVPTSPGVILSNKVILWADGIKEFFIKLFLEKYENSGATKEYLEDKFEVLGNPKLDKVLNTKKEYFTIPKEWQNIIQDKKIIFFNSSIALALRYKIYYLKKIRDVMHLIKDNPNVVLWWRPHPLLVTTYESMLPDLLNAYKSLINEFKVSGSGIYDETTDLYRAIHYADGYYGGGGTINERSSIQYMFTARNIPIMEMEKDMSVTKTDQTDINFEDFVAEKSSKIENIEDVFYFESENFTLEDFVLFISQYDSIKGIDKLKEKKKEAFSNYYKNSDGTCGKAIVDYLAKNIK